MSVLADQRKYRNLTTIDNGGTSTDVAMVEMVEETYSSA